MCKPSYAPHPLWIEVRFSLFMEVYLFHTMKNSLNKVSLLIILLSIIFLPQVTYAAKWVTLNSNASVNVTIGNGFYCVGGGATGAGTPRGQWVGAGNTVHSAPGGNGVIPLGPFDTPSTPGSFTFTCSPSDSGGLPLSGTSGSDTITVCSAGQTVSNPATGPCINPTYTCSPTMTVNGGLSATLNPGDTLTRAISNGCPGGTSSFDYTPTQYKASGTCTNSTSDVWQGWTAGQTASLNVSNTNASTNVANQGCTFTFKYEFTYNNGSSVVGSTPVNNTLVINPPLPATTLTPANLNITYNTAGSLSWSANNGATSCTTGSGSWTTPGTRAYPANSNDTTGNLTTATTFTMYCTNPSGNGATASATITPCPFGTPNWNGSVCVAVPVAPTVTLSAPANIAYNTSPTLSWTVANSAISCTASGTGGTWSGSKNLTGGSEAVGPLAPATPSVSTPYTYTLNCSNAQGSGSDSKVVNVCPYDLPLWNGSSCYSNTTGNITLGATTCTIPSLQSRCGTTVSYSVTNPVVGASTISSSAGGVLASSANSGSLGLLNNANGENVNTYTLTHNGIIRDTKTVTSSCTGGTYWEAATTTPKCLPIPPSGTITATPFSPCTIAKNKSYCDTNVKWNTSYVTNVNVLQDVGLFSTLLNQNSNTLNASTSYGLTTFWLKDADTNAQLAHVDVNAQCVSGSAWDPATTTPRCVTQPLQIGAACSINPASVCTIPQGGSTCTTNIVWSPTNLYLPNVKNAYDIQQDSGQSGGQFSTPVLTYGETASYNCYDDTTFIASTLVTVACSSDSIWSTSTLKCVAQPHTAIPDFSAIVTGNTSIDLSWSCNTKWANSVTVNRVPTSSFVTRSATSSVNTPDPIGGLIKNTLYDYTLTCYEGPNATGPITGIQTVQARTFNDDIVATSCSNGALITSAPACNICPSAKVYDGIGCVTLGTATMCGGTVTTYPAGQTSVISRSCGNGVVDAGEQCDGAIGIASSTLQKCATDCSVIICKNSLANAPGCGLPVGQYCTNGALQTSSPTCNVCPSGQLYDSILGICTMPICGNGVQEVGEQCDDFNQTTFISASKACTFGCCTSAPAPAECFATYSLTCSGATGYALYNKGLGTYTIGTSTYSLPVSWTPSVPGNYELRCVHGAMRTGLIPLNVSGSCAINASPVKLTATPRTIQRGGTVSLNWSIETPNQACKIIALPAIKTTSNTCNNGCLADRIREAANLTNQLITGKTDATDPQGAVRTMISALTSVGGRVQGKKSMKINYTTIFQASCGLNPILDPAAVKVRVQVANDVEG